MTNMYYYILVMLKTNLRQIRRAKDVTQQDLAQAVGVSRQTVFSIEKGRFRPSVELALKLARFLEVTVEELFMLENNVEK